MAELTIAISPKSASAKSPSESTRMKKTRMIALNSVKTLPRRSRRPSGSTPPRAARVAPAGDRPRAESPCGCVPLPSGPSIQRVTAGPGRLRWERVDCPRESLSCGREPCARSRPPDLGDRPDPGRAAGSPGVSPVSLWMRAQRRAARSCAWRCGPASKTSSLDLNVTVPAARNRSTDPARRRRPQLSRCAADKRGPQLATATVDLIDAAVRRRCVSGNGPIGASSVSPLGPVRDARYRRRPWSSLEARVHRGRPAIVRLLGRGNHHGEQRARCLRSAHSARRGSPPARRCSARGLTVGSDRRLPVTRSPVSGTEAMAGGRLCLRRPALPSISRSEVEGNRAEGSTPRRRRHRRLRVSRFTVDRRPHRLQRHRRPRRIDEATSDDLERRSERAQHGRLRGALSSSD